MKHTAKHLFKSCVSLMLVLCMVCSLPLTVLAADSATASDTSTVKDINNDGKIVYVSFGDSVTNGYGLPTYRYDSGRNVLGLYREVESAYPAMIRNDLAARFGEDNVDLLQMAISGFRIDELHWMLDEDGSYVPDPYHSQRYSGWNADLLEDLLIEETWVQEKYGPTYGTSDSALLANADAIISNEYKDAVKKADLITIDLGTNNFGTFVTGTIQYILGLSSSPVEVDFSIYVDENTAASLEAMISQMVTGMVGASSGQAYELTLTLARCLMFGYLGYADNLDAALDEIYRLNPDVQVVVIDVYTMITGIDLTGSALGSSMDLDELYNMFIDMANFYARELSPYAHKVTHASLEDAPDLCIDYYKDYPDSNYPNNQYLHPTAELLMDEFIMEMMGYNPDKPDQRAAFQVEVKDNILLLDSYVFNLQDTVRTRVMEGQINPQIDTIVGDLEDQIDTTISAIELIYTAVEGVKTAKELLPTALEGVEAARSAVDASVEGVAAAKAAVQTAVDGVSTAEAAVDTAIDGVATAESLVEIIVNDVVGNSMFSTSSGMKSIIISVIKSKVSEMDLSVYGFSNDDETVAMLSEEIYEVACMYVNEEDANGTAAAEKAATVEIMRFFLVESKGYSEEDAQATASLAYELNSIYEAEGKPAAVKAAIETEVTGDLMSTLGTASKAEAAEMVYYLGTSETETAVQAAIKTQLTEEKLAALGLSDMTAEEAASLVYELGTLAETDYKAAVIKAMTLKVDQATAELAYAMVDAYEAALTNGGTTGEAEEAAVLVAVAGSLTDENMAALSAFGITDRTKAAEMVCQVALLYNATYAQNHSDKEAVVSCLVTLAQSLGIEGIDEETASTGYDLYTGVYVPSIQAGKSKDEAKALTVTAAIKTKYPAEGLAEAIYAIYKRNATAEQEQLAYITLMVASGIPQDVAVAIYTCYANNLDGQFNNENVKATMLYFMTVALNVTAEEAAELYDQYLLYKNLPTTLSKIAKCDTIYFDALLAAASDPSTSNMLNSVAAKFMNGTLVLDKPVRENYTNEEEYQAAVKTYQSDSALATLFFRFMSQDGVFTHPNEVGQKMLYETAAHAMGLLKVPQADSEIEDLSKVLILGDNIAADESGYADKLQAILGTESTVTNLSYEGLRINEVLALLDSSYPGDAYTTEILSSNKEALASQYASAIAANDVIVVNLGAMNMGFLAPQLDLYMNSNGTDTYSMKFSTIDNMALLSLGARADGLLGKFESAFTGENADVSTGALMLAFKTYGYGYTTFVDCLDDTIETIKALNPDADIVLLGQYNMLGGVYFAANGIHLEMGDFIGHALDLMNRHMRTYAEMNADVTYVDITGTENGVTAPFNMAETGIPNAFSKILPTDGGHSFIANTLACAIGAHIPSGEITWNWKDDYRAASAAFLCNVCGKDITKQADITSVNTATCDQAGQIIYTASIRLNQTYRNEKAVASIALGHDYSSVVTAPSCTEDGFTTHACSRCSHTYTDSPVAATGHSYGNPTWTWIEAEEGFTATAAFTCCNECGTTETIQATMDVTVQESSCNQAGLTTYTATVDFAGQTYSDVKTEPITELAQHSFGEWTQTVDPTCTEAGKEIRICSVCEFSEEREIAQLGHNYQSIVTDPTCTEQGYTTYTCDRCADSYITDSVPATGHKYGEDGKCHCGEIDPEAHPTCEYTVAETLTSGNTYMLTLGGNDVGSFTFTERNGGWTIQAADGTYLALENSNLVYTADSFAWTYADGCFSAETKSSSNNWWGGFFGDWWGSSTKTYYLISSGSTIAVSTSASGAQAAFYTAHSELAHKFGSGVVTTPTCTEQGYTTYTCSRCGYSYTGNPVSASGHNYTASVTAPTCTEQGYTTYTCDVCGDSYTEDYTDANGHNMVDGVCTSCGYTEGTTEPEPPVEPEEPEEGECTYLAAQSLTSGETYILTLGGTQVGTFTFTEISGGWAIQTADGTYLALDDGALVYTAESFAWAYANDCFSAESKSASSNNWWGSFGNWWGSSTKTYYLVSSSSSVAVATSTTSASAAFYQTVTGAHIYSDPVAENGKHIFTCVNCGNIKSEICSDAECTLCHPVTPEASISVSVDVTSSSSGSSWWDQFFGSSKKTYTATITVVAEGTEVESVAYSTNGGSSWTQGTSFTSNSEITAFNIRVEATNGQTYYFTYSNGIVTKTA